LTRRQLEVLHLLSDALRRTGTSPSVSELARRLGITPAAAHQHLVALERKGYLHWPRGRLRDVELRPPAVELTDLGLLRVPVVGRIRAGAPMEAHQDPEPLDWVGIEAGLARGAPPDQLYALQVDGDSMVDACITHGDLVVVRRQDQAENGATVVALLPDGTAALKRLEVRPDGSIWLRPANPFYPTLVVREVRVQGKVLGVIRRLA